MLLGISTISRDSPPWVPSTKRRRSCSAPRPEGRSRHTTSLGSRPTGTSHFSIRPAISVLHASVAMPSATPSRWRSHHDWLSLVPVRSVVRSRADGVRHRLEGPTHADRRHRDPADRPRRRPGARRSPGAGPRGIGAVGAGPSGRLLHSGRAEGPNRRATGRPSPRQPVARRGPGLRRVYRAVYGEHDPRRAVPQGLPRLLDRDDPSGPGPRQSGGRTGAAADDRAARPAPGRGAYAGREPAVARRAPQERLYVVRHRTRAHLPAGRVARRDLLGAPTSTLTRFCALVVGAESSAPTTSAQNRGGQPMSGCLQHPVRSDRQIALAYPGGMPHRVRDGGRSADDPDLADALATERTQLVVMLVDPEHVDVWYVGVARDVIAGQIVIGVVAEPRIHHALLVQRHRQPHRHATDQLRPYGPGVRDPADAEAAKHPAYPDLAGVDVDADLDELGAEGIARQLALRADLLTGVDRDRLSRRGRRTQLAAGLDHRPAPRGHAHRAAGAHRRPEVAVADPHLDPVHRDPEFVGRDLGQRGTSTGADVSGCDQ